MSITELERILFFDIETVPQVYPFKETDERTRQLWADKTRWVQEREEKSPEEIYDRAAIYAEFGKIICISAGFITHSSDGVSFRVKSFYGDDEKKILQDFGEMLNSLEERRFLLCGHNSREFDIPYISRRMLILGMPLPGLLNLQGKKPWEVPHLDTMDLWKFGDYKHYTSLDLLSHCFGLPSPKQEISGKDGARVYWEEHDLEAIRVYCEGDVLTVAQVLLRFNQQPIIPQENVISV